MTKGDKTATEKRGHQPTTTEKGYQPQTLTEGYQPGSKAGQQSASDQGTPTTPPANTPDQGTGGKK